jgi:hypothetical protein
LSIFGQTLLRPDAQYFLVVEYHTSVITNISMPHWHSNIAYYVLTVRVLNYPCQHFPTMQEDISFKEVVEAAIARDLELRTNSQRRASHFGLPYTLDNAVCIAFEI